MTDPGRRSALRRVDWRFLLPEGSLETVAVVGPVDEAVLSGLGQVAGRVVRVDEDEASDQGAGVNLVVAIAPTRSVLDEAMRRVPPGASIYLGAGRGRATGRSSLREVTAALRSAGFVDLCRAWHWPSEPEALEIVPLDDARAVRFALDRRRSGASARLKAALAKIALRLHLLDRIVPGWSVVGRRPWGDAVPTVRSVDPVRGSLPGGGDDASGVILLTPRFRASRHVIGLVLRPRADVLEAVAKLPRAPGDDAGIRREAAALRRAAELGVTGVPEVLALRGAPAPVLVESALDGVVVTSRDVRAGLNVDLAEIEAWTRALAGPPTRRRVPLRALVGPPLERIVDTLDRDAPGTTSVDSSIEGGTSSLDGVAVVRLARRTARILDHLADVAVPTVLEHGDLAPPNILRLTDGRLGVVDWEVADPEGLPLGDLLFFAAFAASGRRDDTGQGAAPTLQPAARAVIERQANHLDIDTALIPALALAMWARWADRQLARFIDRTVPVDQRLPARHLRSWSAALDHLESRG